MNILVIGSGGREHALAWRLSKSEYVKNVHVIPGNPLMDGPKIQAHTIDSLDFSKLTHFAIKNNVDITLVGPEIELSKGIVDYFESKDLKIIGPNKYCAQIESSKEFCKKLLIENNIPTAEHRYFTSQEKALNFLKTNNIFPIVLKMDGLAAGKGVFIPNTYKEAEKFISDVYQKNKLGKRTDGILIESFLEGEEFSQLAFVNGDKIEFMPIVQDYKKSENNNKGENTGGMGAIAPIQTITKESIEQGKTILQTLVLGLLKNNTPYKGILYGGYIQTKDGVKVIEFNARFGDPETEVIMMMLKSDFGKFLYDFYFNNSYEELEWSSDYFCGVVIAAQGYPNSNCIKNIPINIPKINTKDQMIFGMGIQKINDELLSNGGRILIAVSKSSSLNKARQKTYKTIEKFDKSKLHYRTDIALTKE